MVNGNLAENIENIMSKIFIHSIQALAYNFNNFNNSPHSHMVSIWILNLQSYEISWPPPQSATPIMSDFVLQSKSFIDSMHNW